MINQFLEIYNQVQNKTTTIKETFGIGYDIGFQMKAQKTNKRINFLIAVPLKL